ncbi:MAG: SURF1 family protein [Acidimicrobiales bacterium]
MRRFLTWKWVLSHVFVVSMVVAMTGLGFWQLQRLDERKVRNVEVRAAIEADPVPVEALLGNPTLAPDDPPLDQRLVLVAGEYLEDESFFVANRTFESQAGLWLATPMRLADGRIVVVSRGWVPRLWASGDDVREIDTPTGTIEVLGRFLSSVEGGRIGGGSTSILPEVSRLDIGAVEEMLDLDLENSWVQLVEQAPPLGELPIPVPPPGLDEGPHLSYAFQWFFFAVGTVVAYGLILRARSRAPAEH